MSLSTAFQISVYSMAAFAAVMLAVAEGGVLPQGLTVPLAIVAYFLTERRNLLTLPVSWANALGILALLLAASELLSGNIEARLLSGAHLLVYLSWIVLFHPKSERQYWWMIALSAMQVAVGSVLTQDGAYGLLLVLFLVLGIWTLSVFSLYQAREQFSAKPGGRGERPDHLPEDGGRSPPLPHFSFGQQSVVRDSIQFDPHERWISGRFALGTVATSSASMAIAMVFFLLIPRVWIGRGIVRDFSPALPSRAISGFSERVELGALGDILESTEPVLDVRIYDEQTGSPIRVETYASQLGYDEPLFRGAVMDHYEDGGWSMTSLGRRPPQFDQRPFSDSVRQVIRKRPINTEILFAIHPVTSARSDDEEITIVTHGITGILQSTRRSGSTSGDTAYTVYSPRRIANASSVGVPSIGLDLRDRFLRYVLEHYRQLPPGLDRLSEEARRVAGNDPDSNNSERAMKLVSHLRDSGLYSYSLSAEVHDASMDPVEDFLFNRKSGHCEYYASSLALMLRSVGIPARLVNGFKGGKTNRITGAFEVEQRHAHAWVEAWLDGRWIVLDATPSAERAESVEKLGANFPVWVDLKMFIKDLWSRYFVNINMAQQRSEFYLPLKNATVEWWESMRSGRMKASDVIRSILQFLSSPSRWFSWQGGVATFVILLLVSSIVWSARRLHAMWTRFSGGAQRRRRRMLVEFYERFERLCAAQGLVRAPTETPQEFAAAVDAELQRRPQSSGLDRLAAELARAFYRVRYGDETLSHEDLSVIEYRLQAIERSLTGLDRNGGAAGGKAQHAPA